MRSEAGFTLVEVLVAFTILTVGVLGIAGEMALVTGALARGRRVELVSTAVTARLERLRAGACTQRSAGAATVVFHGARLADLQWIWTDLGDSTYRVALVTVPTEPVPDPNVSPDTVYAVVACRH